MLKKIFFSFFLLIALLFPLWVLGAENNKNNKEVGLEIKLNSGLSDQGYGDANSQAIFFQPWNGNGFIAETEIVCPGEGKSFSSESWFGICLADTKHGHRYTVGLVGSDEGLKLGMISYRSMSNLKVLVLGAPDGMDPQRFSLRLEFTSMQENSHAGNLLSFWIKNSQNEWVKITDYNLPDNIMPDRVGLSLEALGKPIGPIYIRYFKLRGQAQEKVYNFVNNKGTQDWQLSNERINITPKYKCELEFMKPDNVFDAGQEVNFPLKLSTELLEGETINLRIEVRDYWDRLVTRQEQQATFREKEAYTEVKLEEGWTEEKGIYTLVVKAGLADEALAEAKKRFAVITPQPFPKTLTFASPFGLAWIGAPKGYASPEEGAKLAARVGVKWERSTWFSWNRKWEGNQWNLSTDYQGVDLRQKYGIVTLPVLDGAADFVALIRDSQKRYGTTMPAYELGNEPENWPWGDPLKDGFNPVAQAQLGTSKVIRQEFPHLQLANAGTTHVNLALLKTIVDKAGQDSFDVASIHYYRTPSPPEPLFTDDLEAVREIAGNKPIWITEVAWFTNDTPLGVDEYTQASYLARMYLYGLSKGVAKIFWFCMNDEAHGLFYSNGDPKPSLVAYNALTSILGSAPRLINIEMGDPHLYAVSCETPEGIITALWSLSGSYLLQFDSEAKFYYDLFGNRKILSRKDGKIQLEIGSDPIYLPGKFTPDNVIISKKTQGEGINSARFKIEIRPHVLSTAEAQVRVYLKNLDNKAIAGKVTLQFASAGGMEIKIPPQWHLVPVKEDTFQLKPGEEVFLDFEPKAEGFDPNNPEEGYLIRWWAEGYFFTAKVQLSDGQEIIYNNGHSQAGLSLRGIPKTKSPVSIDANLNEWDGVPSFDLNNSLRRNVGLAAYWHGEEDFLPTFQLQWDNKYLYLAAVVQDDIHHQPFTDKRMWWGDSIDLGIASEPNALDPLQYHYFTIGFSEKGCNVYRRLPAYDQKVGNVSQIITQAKRENGKTYYELAIPWTVIPPLHPEKGRVLKLGIQFNESDGQYREGWQGWFIGMGGHLVDPRFFGDLTLVEE